MAYDFKGEYLRQVENLQSYRQFYLKKVEEISEQVKLLQWASTEEGLSELSSLRRLLFLYERQIYLSERELEFLRPDTQEDNDYRLGLYGDYMEVFKRIVPDNLPLRFHGTPIFFAKEIIESGEISCTQDRLGCATSHDLDGHISAVTKENIAISICTYAKLHDYCMPMGCVFVLLPNEEDAVIMGDQMKAVNFRSNPNVLYGILTSPENILRVKSWCEENGVDSDKVYEFYSFLEKWKKQKHNSFVKLSKMGYP